MGRILDMLSLPEPFSGREVNGWARYSILTRLPGILTRMINDNTFDEDKVHKLYALANNIKKGAIEPVLDNRAPDYKDWQNYCKLHLGKSWLDVPWFFVEHYFYRKILEILGYFSQLVYQDPFLAEKKRGYESSQQKILKLIHYAFDLLEQGSVEEGLGKLLVLNLWGNQSDLSLFPAQQGTSSTNTEIAITVPDENIIHDHREQIVDWWRNHQVKTIDIIVDNAGYELVVDLVLAYYLLQSGLVETVYLHVKAHPTFVSDANATDVIDALSFLSRYSDSLTGTLAQDLQRLIGHEICVLDSYYWNSPLAGWDMPEELVKHFAVSDLVISKGDANYRRWLGDLMWPPETDLKQVLAYFPKPMILIRTLKSELITNMDAQKINQILLQDDKWMINGKWGIIQFVGGTDA